MNKIIWISLIFGSLNLSCQITDENSSQLQINERIIKEVEKNISEDMFTEANSKMHNEFYSVYNNLVVIEHFVNESSEKLGVKDNRKLPFMSYYYEKGDTLIINGIFGNLFGYGFTIKIIENEPIIYHLVVGNRFEKYSLLKEGELHPRLEIPCKETSLILSKIPEKKEKEIVYGIVEFESEEFYQQNESLNGKNIKERVKNRRKMKIYFKSKYAKIIEKE